MLDIRISSLIKNAAVILVSLGLVASCSPNETGIVEPFTVKSSLLPTSLLTFGPPS